MRSRRARAVALAMAWTIAGCGVQSTPATTTGSPTGLAASSAASSPVPPRTSPSTGAPTLEPTVGAAAGLGPWLPAPDQDSVRRVQFRDIVWTGERFVATATLIEAGGGFLASSDGRIWTHQSGNRPPDLPVSLAAGPGGVVAVGAIDDVAASWFSRDGLTWTARTDAFPIGTKVTRTDGVKMTDVVATDSGWLAVGREDPACNMNCGLAPVRSIVWASADGLQWTRVADQASLVGGAMIAVAHRASGFVAVGLADLRAAAWTSSDGLVWARADGPELGGLSSDDPSEWTTMVSVASGHGVVVAVGHEGPGGAHGPAGRAWWSPDGRSWAIADGADFHAGGETSVMLAAVTATTDGFVAVGWSSGGCQGGIWDSTDGHAWRCAPGADQSLGGLVPYSVAASDSVTAVVGLADVPDPPLDGAPGAAWSRRLP